MPHKSGLNYHKSTTLSKDTCVSIHMYCTLFPLINATGFTPLLWECFFAKQKSQGFVTDHWSSGQDLALTAATLPQLLARDGNPASSCCRLRASKISPPGFPYPAAIQLVSFPNKYLALSVHVSPQTIHFRELDKSPPSRPGRGIPSCNTYSITSLFVFTFFVVSSYYHGVFPSVRISSHVLTILPKNIKSIIWHTEKAFNI